MHKNNKFCFASDNYAGVCPEAWEAMIEANEGFARSYGDDEWTDRASDAIRETFETDCQVFFVFNGTAANSLALAALCHSYHSILVHETAHVETDECGAPEFFSNGTKVLLLHGANGKIDPQEIERLVRKRTDIHYPKPKVVSITQATELGTVYSLGEVQAIGEAARAYDLRLHMDGARFANAVASIGCKPREITWQAGVDTLCLGGAKNGMAMGEAVVFFNKELAHEFDYRCKQAGQLASKMRFLAAPWVGMLGKSTLGQGVWLQRARHANEMAKLLEEHMRSIPQAKILFPRQANSLFLELPPAAVESLRARGWVFYSFIGQGGCRFMCSWDTQTEQVEALVADLREVV